MLINIFLWAGVLSASFWMYNISWQYGLGTLVLLLSLISIASLIRRASTTVLINKDQQKDQTRSELPREAALKQSQPPLSMMPGGIDSNIFERFREKHKVGGSSNIGLPGPYQSPHPPRTNPVRTKTESMEQPSFLNELEDTEQVRVTLSPQTRNSGLGETKQAPFPQSQHIVEKDKTSANSADIQSDSSSNHETIPTESVPARMLSETWPGEPRSSQKPRIESLERTTQPLVREEQLEEAMDDLFADVHIPLSLENQKEPAVQKEPIKSSPEKVDQEDDSQFWQEDQLANLFQKPGPLNETNDEARGLLKIAMAAADSGRNDEARNGLEGYFSMLDEIGKSPDPEAIELKDHLGKKEEQTLENSIVEEPAKKSEIHLTHESESLPDKTEPERINPWENDEQTDYASIMDELVDALEKKEAYTEALPLLQDLLAFNQQQQNQTGMDLIYERIEKAQIALEDTEGLMDTYESHLECKRSLDDRNGLIRILDELGTIHNKAGNSERSQEFHAERLKLVSLNQNNNPEDSQVETLSQ